MVAVSIIMPVYNTGEILRLAVDSILNQTFTDWELLLIDDGSTDNSLKLCDEYAERDNRIRVFHKPNGGICDARNYGMARAEGEYIAFCDHDDEYLPDLLEKVMKTIANYRVDCVKYRNKTILDNGASHELPVHVKNIVYLEKCGCSLSRYASLGYFNTIWTHLYKREIIQRNKLLFDTSFKHGGEDFDFNVRYFQHIKSLVILPDVLYTHYLRGDLSTSAKVYPDLYIKHIEQLSKLNNLIDIQNAPECYHDYEYLSFVIEQVKLIVSYGTRLNMGQTQISKDLLKLKRDFRYKGSRLYGGSLKDNVISFLFRYNMYKSLCFLCKLKS